MWNIPTTSSSNFLSVLYLTHNCSIFASAGHYNSHQIIQDGPDMVKIEGMKPQMKAGKQYRINCTARGSRPPPAMSWFQVLTSSPQSDRRSQRVNQTVLRKERTNGMTKLSVESIIESLTSPMTRSVRQLVGRLFGVSVGWLVGRLVCYNFRKGREVTLVTYRRTYYIS